MGLEMYVFGNLFYIILKYEMLLRGGSTLEVKNFGILGFLMSEYLVSPLIICRKPHLNPIYITIMVTDFKSEITSWNEWRRLRFWPFSQNVVWIVPLPFRWYFSQFLFKWLQIFWDLLKIIVLHFVLWNKLYVKLVEFYSFLKKWSKVDNRFFMT